MAIISQTPFNFGETFTNSLSQSVTANSGDAIVLHMRWRKISSITFDSPSWNGQSLAIIGTQQDDGEALSATYWVQASSTGTHDLIGTFSDYVIAAGIATVVRLSAGTISVAGFQSQIYTGTGSADPSLTLTGVPSGATTMSFLGNQGWHGGYGNVATTLSPNSPLTGNSTITNTTYRGVWAVSNANAGSATGSVNAAWTRSDADEPMFTHVAFYLNSALTSPTIDSGTNPVSLGTTGNTINTSNLGTLTSLTIGGVAVTSLSAPSGDGTFSIAAWADGVVGTPLGTQTQLAGDGTDTASRSVTVNPGTNRDWVALTSVNTAVGYLGAYVSLNIGDQIHFPTAASLSVTANYIDVDGGIYTDYAGSQVIYKRHVSTGVVTAITLINGEPVVDTTPDPFTFTDVTNATLSTQYTSNTVTVSGINSPANISITGGTYSINGGAYTSSSGTILNGQTVTVRVTSSGSFSTAVNAVLTIGGVSDTYSVTTLASDTTPNAFTFTDVTGATISTQYTSNSITVTGINSPAAISITGGTYNVNGGSYTSSSGNVSLNDVVTVRTTSSSSFSTAVNVVLTIGGVSDTYTVTTQAADTTPSAFTFVDVSGASQNTVYTSNAITVLGINSPANISITGGTYSIDGGAFTSSSGTVSLNQTVSVRVTSSASLNTAVSATLTIGGVSDTYTVTTAAVAPTSDKSKGINIGIKIGI